MRRLSVEELEQLSKDLLSLPQPNSMEQLALLWLKYFPEIDDLFSQYKERSDFKKALTKEVFRRIEVLSLAYLWKIL